MNPEDHPWARPPDGADEWPVRPGDAISVKYEVEGVMSVGARGLVAVAVHRPLGERVASKLLLPKAAKIPEHRARFLREAQSSAQLKGEHVARVRDVGTLPDELPYIVMEFLEGRDLAAHL